MITMMMMMVMVMVRIIKIMITMMMMMVMATMLTRLMVTELMWNKIRATGTAPNQDQTKEEPSQTAERNS